MATLLLRLAAPLQAWGVDSRFEIRQTEREPSKSGVVGLLAAALGIRRGDTAALAPLNELRFGVRVDQEGVLLRDFQMVYKDRKTSYLTQRYYLADAVFLVGLESEDACFLQTLADALHHPAFPLFLGRRSCPPAMPLVLEIVDEALLPALQTTPWQASAWYQKKNAGAHLRVITDAFPGEQTRAFREDLPVSFDQRNRQYRYRPMLERSAALPMGPTTEHDPMQELR
jgi:CRISPR system Cascade subunit CasD